MGVRKQDQQQQSEPLEQIYEDVSTQERIIPFSIRGIEAQIIQAQHRKDRVQAEIDTLVARKAAAEALPK